MAKMIQNGLADRFRYISIKVIQNGLADHFEYDRPF